MELIPRLRLAAFVLLLGGFTFGIMDRGGAALMDGYVSGKEMGLLVIVVMCIGCVLMLYPGGERE